MPVPASAFRAADLKGSRARRERAEIILSDLTAEDLPAYVEGQWLAFGPAVYDILEPPSIRPPHALRLANAVARNSILLSSSAVRLRKASLPDGTLVGVAFWYIPGHPEWRNPQTRDGSEEAVKGTGLWEGIDGKEWDAFYGNRGGVDRKRAMGDELIGELGASFSAYLAPLWVLPSYHGRGVASALMREAVAWADESSPPRRMYLESTPTGRAVYAQFGFQLQEEMEGGVMIRPARVVEGEVKA
ncbi:acyl-CoA N-acyltransferase [Leucosporidium creatinivorum]|uniref:Acyl-CoA N-acyltransferase n=1 Tax=Leucosporidium creatinivorum TaxID=106004 RepID=A0A1Y2DUB5_9BASI|nr:acyl-CoA N-acyltransferase [Leucosporidium creatinivorum]